MEYRYPNIGENFLKISVSKKLYRSVSRTIR